MIQIRLQNLLEPVDKETHAPRQIVPVRHHDRYWQGFRTQIGKDFDQLTTLEELSQARQSSLNQPEPGQASTMVGLHIVHADGSRQSSWVCCGHLLL